jgi:enoyl-CoA hydratase/carnithine racemase
MNTDTQSLSRPASGPYDYIISSVDGPVAIVTLNRPKQLNALAHPLLLELVDVIEQHDANPVIRVMVITGGTSVFAAGADITGHEAFVQIPAHR